MDTPSLTRTQVTESGKPNAKSAEPGTRQRLSIISVTAHSDPHRKKAQIGIVEGFGDAVPLAFAVRQIVPKIIHVVYGPGVDPETKITWRGGHAWAAVLRDSLKPVGLSLDPHGGTVEIRK